MSELIGIIILLWVTVIGMEHTPEYKLGEEDLIAIEKCEKELSRAEKCVIIAIKLESKESGDE